MPKDQSYRALEILPNEILSLVLSQLDIRPPSLRNLRREPSTLITCSHVLPLKSLSLTCHRLRSVVLPWLFKFSRIHLSGFEQHSIGPNVYSAPRSADIDQFLSFVTKESLAPYIQGVVLFTHTDFELRSTGQLGSDPSKPASCLELAGFWRSVLQVLNLKYATTCAPPSTLARLVSCDVATQDAWAFDMKLHILHLRRLSRVPHPNLPEIPRMFDVFYLLPWTHCTLNEGSSLKVYNTYEYYHKITPSIVNRLTNATKTASTLSSLTSFEYIAIFPMCQHVRGTVVPRGGIALDDGCGVLDLLMLFPCLEKLQLQLAPHPDDEILEDLNRLQIGSLADMWLEFDGCYDAVLGTITDLYANAECPRISRFVSLDYSLQLGDMQTTIEEHCTRDLPEWYSCGNGHWQRVQENEIR